MDDIVDGLSEVSSRRAGDRWRHCRPDGRAQGQGIEEPARHRGLCWRRRTSSGPAPSRMGMDGLNNAVIPGYATPEQYTKEITIAE